MAINSLDQTFILIDGAGAWLGEIVAFLAPQAFNAWDTYARKGLKAQTGSLKIRSYTATLNIYTD